MMKERRKIVVRGNNEQKIRLDLKKGENEKELVVIVLGKKGICRVEIEVNHLVSSSKSKVVVKVLAFFGVSVQVEGVVRVKRGVSCVESRLEMKGLVLGNGAEIDFRPNLEIEADEVNVSHAATVSAIDEEQKFYLMSRGLDSYEADKLIVRGFLREIA